MVNHLRTANARDWAAAFEDAAVLEEEETDERTAAQAHVPAADVEPVPADMCYGLAKPKEFLLALDSVSVDGLQILFYATGRHL